MAEQSLALALALVAALVVGSGCKSVSQCVAPRVEGRVVDSRTRLPIPEVVVRRISANDELRIKDPPKGGQALKQTAGVRTAENGAFRLDSVRNLAVFRHLSWYSVTLSFEHSNYTRLFATYTVADTTNGPAAEPTIATGDILLVPKAP